MQMKALDYLHKALPIFVRRDKGLKSNYPSENLKTK
jgi:hypothetical protein